MEGGACEDEEAEWGEEPLAFDGPGVLVDHFCGVGADEGAEGGGEAVPGDEEEEEYAEGLCNAGAGLVSFLWGESVERLHDEEGGGDYEERGHGDAGAEGVFVENGHGEDDDTDHFGEGSDIPFACGFCKVVVG